MRCIIIEDQPPAQRLLRKYIDDTDSLQLCAVFTGAVEALEFLKTESVDLIFLDIHLPKLSGLDFIKSLTHPPHIILTTAFPDYALESYELNVVDYLLKPFSFQRFLQAVSKVPDQGSLQTERPKELYIKSGYEHIKVNTEEIRYIRSDEDYTEIHLPGKKLLSTEPLSYWMDTLDNKDFNRVHKSYIVNGLHIQKVSGNQIFLKDHDVIPIGRAFKEDFMKRILK